MYNSIFGVSIGNPCSMFFVDRFCNNFTISAPVHPPPATAQNCPIAPATCGQAIDVPLEV